MSTIFSSTPASKRGPGQPRWSNEFIRTLPVVAILTVLIWIWAERAQNRDDAITTPLQLTSSGVNLAVSPIDGADTTIKIDVNGPRGQIDALRNHIDSAIVDGKLRVALPNGESTPGQHTLELARLLNDEPLFSGSGVTVTKTTPQQLKVLVEPVTSRDVAVVLPREQPVQLLSYSFEPSTVAVRGPEQALATEFSGVNPTIVADLTGLRDAVAANQTTLDVPLVVPHDPRLRLVTQRVKLVFKPGSTVHTVDVKAVGILVERNLSDDGAGRVVMKRGPVLQNIRLRGPATLVDRFGGDSPTDRLQAVLQIFPEDLGKTGLQRAVKFPYLDPRVEVLGGAPEVSFDVEQPN